MVATLGEGTALSRASVRRTAAAVLAVCALFATGCGSRLSTEERAEALAALTGGSAGVVEAGGEAGTTAGTDGSTTTTTGEGTAGTAGTGGDAGGGGGGGGDAGVASCAKATKGTDTGVTADKIRLATLADVSGVQPGLFQSAHQAARAAAAYINSQGGICGRQVEALALDSKTDAGGNRSAMLEACEKAFAVVGSMSAFDDGSAKPGQDCGIPDMTAITTNRSKYNATNTFPIYPQGPNTSTTNARYIAKRFPDVIKKAAILWLNQAVTKSNADNRKRVWESVGYEFIYEAEVQVLEANYTRFVSEMESRGVQYVTMVADYQNIVRLQKTMRQQGYVPKVRDWDSVAYDPDYLADQQAVEGSFVFINTAMFEEASSNAEMKLYTDWLKRASPGAAPDYFGLYAWSAYRLFQKLASDIGPDLTRKKLLDALKSTKEWGANGLHGPHQIGAKVPTSCNLYVEVKGGKFQRMAPASGFDCSGSIFRE